MKYRVAQRHFRRALRGMTLAPDVERQGAFVRLAFDEYGLNRHTDAESIAKANLAAQIVKFETMCAPRRRG